MIAVREGWELDVMRSAGRKLAEVVERVREVLAVGMTTKEIDQVTEAAILAVSAVREDVIVKDGAIKAGQTLNLTLSGDHRLIDGTLGAQFMARLKALLENPVQLIA